jgi:hypothetical protein
MENFNIDSTYSVSNKQNFSELLDARKFNLLKKEICEFILQGKEDSFYDLDDFNRLHVKNMKKTLNMAKTISEELHCLGWKTFLGYGETGLFIYSSEEKPHNAY